MVESLPLSPPGRLAAFGVLSAIMMIVVHDIKNDRIKVILDEYR